MNIYWVPNSTKKKKKQRQDTSIQGFVLRATDNSKEKAAKTDVTFQQPHRETKTKTRTKNKNHLHTPL